MLARIRYYPRTSELPMIVMTAQATVSSAVERLATALVPKPFDVDTLLLVIEQLVENASLQRQALES